MGSNRACPLFSWEQVSPLMPQSEWASARRPRVAAEPSSDLNVRVLLRGGDEGDLVFVQNRGTTSQPAVDRDRPIVAFDLAEEGTTVVGLDHEYPSRRRDLQSCHAGLTPVPERLLPRLRHRRRGGSPPAMIYR
jgi:hypothetical protein